MIQGEAFDVWVVEERCNCGEERMYAEVEGYRKMERSNSNSGDNHGWKGEDGDLFSDGRSESDGSEPYNSLLGLQQVEKLVSVKRPGAKKGTGNIDLGSQNLSEGNVGESFTVVPIQKGNVMEEGELVAHIPICEEVGEVNSVRGVEGEQKVGPSNISNQVGVLAEGHVRGEPGSMESGSRSGPFGPNAHLWNPFVDGEAQVNKALVNSPIICGLSSTEEGQTAREGTLVECDVEGGGAMAVGRFSQLSESSSESLQGKGGQNRRNTKKNSRIAPPMIGVPKFRQLEQSLKAAGRKRKEVGKKITGGGSITDIVFEQQTEEPIQEEGSVDRQAELPLEDSGLNHLFDNEGGFIPESIAEDEGDAVPKDIEANILMVIQKEVGFSFQAGEDQIHGKLMELDNIDREKNVELVQEGGS
jgi:hypothetical protein